MRRWFAVKPIKTEAVIGDCVGRALLENSLWAKEATSISE